MNFLDHMRERSRARSLPVPNGPALPVRPLAPALTGMAVIAEVKYATPADGLSGITEPPEVIARRYAAGGAAAVSCLTEPEYFHGDPAYIPRIRAACHLPVLMKDFIVDPRQIEAGRAFGADAVLLIVAMLDPAELRDLLACTRDLDMEALVEVHDLEEINTALAAGARILGVNCRNLTTLEVDPDHHINLAPHLPAETVNVAESGITSRRRLEELSVLGYDAALVGRALMNPGTREEVLSCG